MRAESLACYGHPLVETPNYDRVANEGTRFDKCFVQNSQCTESRVSMMTGLYPHCAGHRTLWHLIRPHEPHLFKYLYEGGYDIHWFGKNDLLAPESLGCIKEYCEPMGIERENLYKFGEKEYYSFHYKPLNCEHDEIGDYIKVKAGIDFLRTRKSGANPFFLFLPLLQPHPSYTTHSNFYNLYKAQDIPDLRPANLDKKPNFYELIRKYRRLDELDAMFFKQINAIYLGMISYTDWLLGELLDVMDELNLFEDTVLIISSDHGDWAGDFGLVEKWPTDYSDPISRVPLIVKAPGGVVGHTVNEPIEMLDLMASVLELADIPSEHTHFSRSFVPNLNGQRADPNRCVFAEGGYGEAEPHAFEGRWDRSNPPVKGIYYPKGTLQQEEPETVCRTTMIRTMKHKLIRRPLGQDELYDLVANPGETHNLVDEPSLRDTKRDLENSMLEWFIETSDTVPVGRDPRRFPS